LRASFNVLWSGCESGVYFSKSWNSNYSVQSIPSVTPTPDTDTYIPSFLHKL
jgi:hypothetical protein